jgi:hypothetical protein
LIAMSKLALLGGAKAIGEEGRALKANWPNIGLEAALCDYTGAKYAKCVSAGTAALISGLFAAGCGPGDEVITVAYTWVATVGAVLRVNAVPIFADIDPRTFCIDPEDVKRKISPATKAILAVDYYGHPAPIPELMAIAEEHGLVLIEDACQASTSEINGQKVGNLAHFTAFSWSGKPIYSGSGGGAFLTSDRHLYERALLAGQHPTVIQGLATDPDVLKYASMGGTGDNMRAVGTDAMAQLMDAEVRTHREAVGHPGHHSTLRPPRVQARLPLLQLPLGCDAVGVLARHALLGPQRRGHLRGRVPEGRQLQLRAGEQAHRGRRPHPHAHDLPGAQPLRQGLPVPLPARREPARL